MLRSIDPHRMIKKFPQFWPELEKVGKMNYCLGKMDPDQAKCLKNGQTLSRSGQKTFIHILGCLAAVQ